MTKDGIAWSFQSNLAYALAKDEYTATAYDDFLAVSMAVRDRLVERWIATQQRYHKKNLKRVYYLSLEFLIGRLLGTNMLNLGLMEQTKDAVEEVGLDIEELRECEADAGLGNGGLGRLAACFLDSMATLGIPAHGYGIRYEYGIFNQKIVNGQQVEFPDTWLSHDNPWEFARPEHASKVKFYGNTRMYHDEKGDLRVEWADTGDVLAMPYDIPIPGFRNDIVNTLRLWSAHSTEEFDLRYFNEGDYEQAVYDKVLTENISKVLYPSDNNNEGKELRLKQEYFFTAASIADIVRRFKSENTDLSAFPDKVAIQLNDTHPAIAIPELMRILIDKEKLGWDEAWRITVKTVAYTNHTIMPEALESWPVDMFGMMLPRHLQIIYEINLRFLREVAAKFPGDNDRLRSMSIIDEDGGRRIRMGNLAVIGSHSVNGVSELHSRLIQTNLFADFYRLFPKKFNNKTNGVTQRRWLQKANPDLSALITEAIGDAWISDLSRLKDLEAYKSDASFLKKWQDIKALNKKCLAHYIRRTTGVEIDPASLFDVQVKRIHEYKRQLLLALYVLAQYVRIKKDPKQAVVPRTFMFGGKAAPGYFMAKLVIKFINNICDVVNRDKDMRNRLKVIFLENYRVSLAEKVFPASDLSEQISTAGTEASGTGCMKFMLNGALTVGTYDGANIEIAEEVGRENIFLFGLKANEIEAMRISGYDPQLFIDRSPALKEVFDLIRSNFLSPVEFGLFDSIIGSLRHQDNFFVCADFDDYCGVQDDISIAYKDSAGWAKRSVVNVARSGKFSSDRTIWEYAKEIWNVPVEGGLYGKTKKR
ncbi:MAG: glycogen/starch/alpha-glucan phosphorylase [Candidatus Omnitrophica bacterium]|nr:glycogen/starch/alpha-glucan phosphorylase [Candidatus Omnitrophota bacterium]